MCTCDFTPIKRNVQRNYRSEVAHAFPQVPLVKGRRCVVLADGFYEWQRRQATNHRQPYFIYFPQIKTEKVLAAACPSLFGSPGFLDVWFGVIPVFFFSAINYLFRFFFCAIISSFWDSRYTGFKTVSCHPIASRCLIYFILFLCVSVWTISTDLFLSSVFSLIYS